MPSENPVSLTAARLAALPFRFLALRSFQPPQKILILKPCCLSQVLMTTPLLAALSEAYPRAQIDWAISEWARPAIASNPRLSEIIDTGQVGLPQATRDDVRHLINRLSDQEYDTCFIPDRSLLLTRIAWQVGIPQRIGLNDGGRGFAHTLPVKIPRSGTHPPHESVVYLSLAQALGIEAEVQMEFYPPDPDRAEMTRRLVDEIDWLGDVPLVIIHPGGGTNPTQLGPPRRWPPERFALLANHLVRTYQARILLVGAAEDRPVANAVAGLMAVKGTNLAGRVSLGELGALCEVADLYIGNDTGPTHIAAALGCPTLAIFGPGNPAISGPYASRGPVTALWHEPPAGDPNDNQVTPAEAVIAADQLMTQQVDSRLQVRENS